MNYQNIASKWLLFFLFSMSVISCRKTSFDIDMNSYQKESVVSWLDKQASISKAVAAGRILKLKQILKFNESFSEGEGDNQKKMLVIPIDRNHKFNNNKDEVNPQNFLLIFFDNNSNIEKGLIVQYKSLDFNKTLPKNAFNKIFNTNNIDFKGRFTFFSISDKFEYEMSFEGDKRSTSIIMPKTSGDLQRKATSSYTFYYCIDYYLITKIYYDGLVIYYNEQFIERVCVNLCDSNNPTSIIVVDCESIFAGGGGATGSSSCDTTEKERTILWSAFLKNYDDFGSGYYDVQVKTKFKGKIKDCITNEGLFKDISHVSSKISNYGINPYNSSLPFASWNEAQVTSAYYQSQASVNILGTVTEFNGEIINVSHFSYWMYHQVFP